MRLARLSPLVMSVLLAGMVSWSSAMPAAASARVLLVCECNPKSDYIQFQAVGEQSTGPIHWINRPTFQQVVQYPLP